jgi:hypothetical protein
MDRREFIAATCTISAIASASQAFAADTAANQKIPVPPRWPSYIGASQFVGTSPSGRVTVFVDPSLGHLAVQNAIALVIDADRIVECAPCSGQA